MHYLPGLLDHFPFFKRVAIRLKTVYVGENIETHPVGITHAETGRPALYVNRLMTARINGLDETESDALIEELLSVAEDPTIVYEHIWRPGDLVMWDNRCVTHARTDFPENEHRLLRRSTTEGAQPFETMAEYANAK